jgi:hypothetical protein
LLIHSSGKIKCMHLIHNLYCEPVRSISYVPLLSTGPYRYTSWLWW